MQPEESAQGRGTEHELDRTGLSSTELRTWITFWATTRVVDNVIDRDLRARSGLSHIDYQFLVILSNAPECRLRMSELADTTFESRSRLTYQITQLERVGLVRREECVTDRRGAVAVLTPEGREMLRVTAPGHIATVRRIFFDRLTSEQVSLLGDILQSIFAELGASVALERLIEGEVGRIRKKELKG